MLAEVLIYALSPAPLASHRGGLVRDAVSLWSRARRCRAAWAPHEAACAAAVARAIAGVPGRDCVMVLGSGLMRDVPLDGLAGRFGRIVLVDAVHLLPVRLATLGRKDVVLVSGDLTAPGAVTALIRRWSPDLVISANVLSQLPLSRDDDAASAVVAAHLSALAAAPCPTLLLTDTDERRIDTAGRTLETLDLLHGHVLPPPDASWDWLLAPPGEIAGGATLVHRAGSWFRP